MEGTDALLVLLFFGLRKSELKSLRIIDNKWLECETSKERLGQNVVLRKIPFTPAAKKVIPYIDFEKAKKRQLKYGSNKNEKAFFLITTRTNYNTLLSRDAKNAEFKAK